jgi:hypothetical protein
MSSASIDTVRAAESNLGWILGINATLHALALIFVGLRVYTRLVVKKAFGKDDAMILLSAVSRLLLLDPHRQSCKGPFISHGTERTNTPSIS